jgi:hypothetical protein
MLIGYFLYRELASDDAARLAHRDGEGGTP